MLRIRGNLYWRNVLAHHRERGRLCGTGGARSVRWHNNPLTQPTPSNRCCHWLPIPWLFLLWGFRSLGDAGEPFATESRVSSPVLSHPAFGGGDMQWRRPSSMYRGVAVEILPLVRPATSPQVYKGRVGLVKQKQRRVHQTP